MAPFHANSALVESIGWLLVHSLWQFTAIGLASAALLWLLRRASSETRYWSGLLALCAMVAAPLMTWHHLPTRIAPGLSGWRSTAEIASPQTDSATDRERQARPPLATDPEPATAQLHDEPARESTRQAASAPRPTWWPSVERMVTPWLSAIVLGWCGGVLLFALRPLASWLAIRQLRSRGISGVSPVVAERLARVAKRLDLRQAVRVVQSTL